MSMVASTSDIEGEVGEGGASVRRRAGSERVTPASKGSNRPWQAGPEAGGGACVWCASASAPTLLLLPWHPHHAVQLQALQPTILQPHGGATHTQSRYRYRHTHAAHGVARATHSAQRCHASSQAPHSAAPPTQRLWQGKAGDSKASDRPTGTTTCQRACLRAPPHTHKDTPARCPHTPQSPRCSASCSLCPSHAGCHSPQPL